MDAAFWDGLRAPGIPNTVDTEAYNNVLEIIEQAFAEHAQRPAFTGINHTLSYAEIDQLSDAFCRYLQHNTNLKPGDRIAIQMANLLQYPVVIYGALRAGLVVVNTNPLYTAREMRHQFKDSGAKALIFMSTFGDSVAEVIADTDIETVIVTNLGDLLPTGKRLLFNFVAKHVKKMVPSYDLPQQLQLRDVLAQGKKAPARQSVSPKRDDLAMLQYTGGTTGAAKGAMLSHGNLVANMMQINGILEQHNEHGQPLFDKTKSENIVAPLPLYHIYAFSMHLMSAAYNGQHNILIANPRDANTFVRALKPWKINVFIGLNTLFVSLLKHPEFRKLDFSGLKATNSGGTALVPDTASRWRELTGCNIGEGYGLTECSPVVSASGAGAFINPESVGLPVPNTALKTVDSDGKETALGEPGELCVKGPQVMQGYWQRPDATAEVIDEDGWFHTGDIATIDEQGIVRIVDRLKDMVLVSGFNVFPNEIENVVLEHPQVELAAAIGVKDDKTGEAVKLFVVPTDPTLTKETLLSYCREQLTAYKIPKYIEFRDELPMTPVGKVLRKELRKETEEA
jgi:long-chain acyl-CoA synthetase